MPASVKSSVKDKCPHIHTDVVSHLSFFCNGKTTVLDKLTGMGGYMYYTLKTFNPFLFACSFCPFPQSNLFCLLIQFLEYFAEFMVFLNLLEQIFMNHYQLMGMVLMVGDSVCNNRQ